MSKLTPNSELSLCFPAELLPESIPLPSDYVLRPLSSTDYRRGHLKVLSVLTLAPDVGETAWKERFDLMIEAHETYYCVVVVNKTNDQIVGTGTLPSHSVCGPLESRVARLREIRDSQGLPFTFVAIQARFLWRRSSFVI